MKKYNQTKEIKKNQKNNTLTNARKKEKILSHFLFFYFFYMKLNTLRISAIAGLALSAPAGLSLADDPPEVTRVACVAEIIETTRRNGGYVFLSNGNIVGFSIPEDGMGLDFTLLNVCSARDQDGDGTIDSDCIDGSIPDPELQDAYTETIDAFMSWGANCGRILYSIGDEIKAKGE